MENNLSIIEDALKAKNIRYKRVGERFLIRCLNSAHDDHNPSMFIFPEGSVFCFGCKYKSDVNKLFGIKVFGENHFGANIPKLKLPEKKLPEYPALDLPLVTKSYFGLSKKILETVDAREDKNGIIFPIYLNSRMIGWQKRLFVPNHIKYVSSPKVSESHFTDYFYPLDLVVGERRLVLLEGILDALAFIDAGIPAISNFGLYLTKNKFSLLKQLMVETLVIGFDMDDPGLLAEMNIYSKLNGRLSDVRVLPIHNNINPRKTLQQSDAYARKVRELLTWQKS